MPVLHILITVVLLHVLKSGSVRPQTLFSFKIVLAIWCSLRFHLDFSIYAKTAVVVLLGIALNLRIALGSIDILTILFSNP